MQPPDDRKRRQRKFSSRRKGVTAVRYPSDARLPRVRAPAPPKIFGVRYSLVKAMGVADLIAPDSERRGFTLGHEIAFAPASLAWVAGKKSALGKIGGDLLQAIIQGEIQCSTHFRIGAPPIHRGIPASIQFCEGRLAGRKKLQVQYDMCALRNIYVLKIEADQLWADAEFGRRKLGWCNRERFLR